MNNQLIPNVFMFIGLILIQVLVINNLEISYYINPYVYPLIILSLPFQMPRWLLMIFGFIVGLTMDAFCNTMGLHAAASVFLAFIRPYVAQILTPRDHYGIDDQPTVRSLGYTWFTMYVVVLIPFHHFLYFFLEVFSMEYFFRTFGKTVVSSFFSIVLILLLATIFSTGKKKG